MDRRDFGTTLAAWVAFITALFLTRGTAVAASAPVPTEAPERKVRVFEDFEAMLFDIKAHTMRTGEEVLCADNPLLLQIGFETPTQRWEIRLTHIRSTMPDELRESLRTSSGRVALARALSAPQS